MFGENPHSGLAASNQRVNILGVGAMPMDLPGAVATLERWRAEKRRDYVCLISVHGLVVAQRDPVIRESLNRSGLAAEDGMPFGLGGLAFQVSREPVACVGPTSWTLYVAFDSRVRIHDTSS